MNTLFKKYSEVLLLASVSALTGFEISRMTSDFSQGSLRYIEVEDCQGRRGSSDRQTLRLQEVAYVGNSSSGARITVQIQAIQATTSGLPNRNYVVVNVGEEYATQMLDVDPAQVITLCDGNHDGNLDIMFQRSVSADGAHSVVATELYFFEPASGEFTVFPSFSSRPRGAMVSSFAPYLQMSPRLKRLNSKV